MYYYIAMAISVICYRRTITSTYVSDTHVAIGDDENAADENSIDDLDAIEQSMFAYVNKYAIMFDRLFEGLSEKFKITDTGALHSQKIALLKDHKQILYAGMPTQVQLQYPASGILNAPAIGVPYKIGHDINVMTYEKSGTHARIANWSTVRWGVGEKAWICSDPTDLIEPEAPDELEVVGVDGSITSAYAAILDIGSTAVDLDMIER